MRKFSKKSGKKKEEKRIYGRMIRFVQTRGVACCALVLGHTPLSLPIINQHLQTCFIFHINIVEEKEQLANNNRPSLLFKVLYLTDYEIYMLYGDDIDAESSQKENHVPTATCQKHHREAVIRYSPIHIAEKIKY